MGRKAVLSNNEEADLVKRITRFAEIGLLVTPRILRRLVYKFCDLNNIKKEFKNNTRLAGKDW